MHHFPLHLVINYCTLQFITVAEMTHSDALHRNDAFHASLSCRLIQTLLCPAPNRRGH